MQNIQVDIGNNAQKILPIPYSSSPVPVIDKPMNYGDSPYPMAVKDIPNRKNDNLQYCNFLEPSPRDQRLNLPYEGQKNCPTFKSQPYSKDSCYLLDSKSQGVVGIVCNQAGGSDNANFARGNQFGVDYPLNQKLNTKILEYTVENPVQLKMEKENPLVIYDKNTFYPEPSFGLRKNKDFITYPLQQNYTETGLPTYTYPYKTMNNVFDKSSDGIKILENYSNNLNNNEESKERIFFIILIIFIFLIFIFMPTFN